MAARVFRAHGEFCATHPWEVIVATLTLTACLLTLDRQQSNADAAFHKSPPYKYCPGCLYEVSVLQIQINSDITNSTTNVLYKI